MEGVCGRGRGRGENFLRGPQSVHNFLYGIDLVLHLLQPGLEGATPPLGLLAGEVLVVRGRSRAGGVLTDTVSEGEVAEEDGEASMRQGGGVQAGGSDVLDALGGRGVRRREGALRREGMTEEDHPGWKEGWAVGGLCPR